VKTVVAFGVSRDGFVTELEHSVWPHTGLKPVGCGVIKVCVCLSDEPFDCVIAMSTAELILQTKNSSVCSFSTE